MMIYDRSGHRERAEIQIVKGEKREKRRERRAEREEKREKRRERCESIRVQRDFQFESLLLILCTHISNNLHILFIVGSR